MTPRAVLVALLTGMLGTPACTTVDPVVDPPARATSAAAPTATSSGAAASSRSLPSKPAAPPPATSTSADTKTLTEPTATNTLPPPPIPSGPAPSTVGQLTASSLPVPAGWRAVARQGGLEEGYAGNGTWVHGRDPRYAAAAVLTLGCAAVSRDDYPDPVAALEGTYEKKGARRQGDPGIGLVLQFATRRQAGAYYRGYVSQVRACSSPDSPVSIEIVPSELGLIDHRTSADGDWTEVGRLAGTRLSLVILTDPRHRRTRAESERLLRQLAR